MAIGRAGYWSAIVVLLPAFGLPALTFAAVEAKRVDFGTLQDGTRVAAVELSNGASMSVRIIALGAAIQSLNVPDRKGNVADVVLGHDTPREYLAKPQYFGATIGRYANRIAHGKFTLDDRQYTLETNDGPNHLHGGVKGFDKALWNIDQVTSGSPARVTLSYVSRDGAGGYPGTLQQTDLPSCLAPSTMTATRPKSCRPRMLKLVPTRLLSVWAVTPGTPKTVSPTVTDIRRSNCS